MELYYLTAPLFDEHGNLDDDEEVHEHIASMVGEPNEEEQVYDAHEVEGGHDYEEEYTYYDEEATYHEEHDEVYEYPVTMVRFAIGREDEGQISMLHTCEGDHQHETYVGAAMPIDMQGIDGLLFDSWGLP